MPLISYTKYRPNAEARAIIDLANVILNQYNAQGFDLTLRQLYYQFIARDIFPNRESSYNRLGDIIGKAREAGMIDWDYIKDRARRVERFSHWDSPSDIIDTCARSFRLDLWTDQPYRVEVWVEKEALVDVVGRAAENWDVPYFANKGYVSLTSVWEAGHNRFKRWHDEFGQKILVLHLGDHDPSGIDMTRDIEERLLRFSSPYSGSTRADIEVRRIALNMDQVQEYDPPPNPAKLTDVRARGYIDRFGEESWELDALEPAVIVDLIEAEIRGVCNMRRFNIRQRLQDQYRDELRTVARQWPVAVAAATEAGNDEEDEEDAN